ncbi:acyl carrier protein [Cellulosilyticum ruminicola]|uniref:acyl carrier protein n=1 Tax=Cellulosilyticum ruminicola TaxID=425254 RepID=UPI0006D22904|nr:acyl carrier protein [Cellulosilyticum ruminicola]
MDLAENLKQIVAEVLKIEESVIKPKSSLRYDLIVTSISFIKIVTKIEDIFEIEVDDDALDIEEDMDFQTFCSKVEKIINDN